MGIKRSFDYFGLKPATYGSQLIEPEEPIATRTGKKKTNQFDVAKANTWGIIQPYNINQESSDTFRKSQNGTSVRRPLRWYGNQCLFRKESSNFEVYLDYRRFDVSDSELSRCGQYYLIEEYGGHIMLFEIFTQLMYECTKPWLSDQLWAAFTKDCGD